MGTALGKIVQDSVSRAQRVGFGGWLHSEVSVS